MKKLLVALAVGLSVLAGCKKALTEEAPIQDIKSFTTISANITDETKTSLDIPGRKLTWVAGDRIMVQDRANMATKVIFTLDPDYAEQSNGVFRIYDSEGNIDPEASISGTEFNVFYLNSTDQPIENWGKEGTVSLLSEQTYVPDGIQENIIPMCTYSDDLSNVNLKSQASVLSINLKNPDETEKVITAIELTSTTYISGNAFIDIDSNTRTYIAVTHESWSAGGQPTLYQRKYVKLNVGEGITLSAGETKGINIAVTRNSYPDLCYTITYTEGGATKKCIISSSKRPIATNGGETILLGTQNLRESAENIYFIVNKTEYSVDEFENLTLTEGATVQVRSRYKVNEDEVLALAETDKALRLIGSKKTKVNIDLSQIRAGITNVTSANFSAIKGYTKDFYFPKDVKTISTFQNLGTFGNIYLNEGLTTIEGMGSGFYEQVMETIHIPASVTSIGTANFDKASGIVVAEGNPNYRTDGVALYTLKEIDGKKVPYMLSSICGRVDLSKKNGVYEIPETVVGHLQYAQDHASNIKTLVVPKGFKTISSSHLRYCSNLSCIRFKSTTSLFAWTLSSDMPKNGTIEIVMPEGSTEADITASLASYYSGEYNYKSWVEAGWTINVVDSTGKVLKTSGK